MDTLLREADKDNQVYCATHELKLFITEWCNSARWEYENFAEFLEQIGIKMPVLLYNKKKSSFQCMSADENLEISLELGCGKYFLAKIYAKRGKETRIYRVNYNDNYFIGPNNCFRSETFPKVTLSKRCFERNKKIVKQSWCTHSFQWQLEFEDLAILNIEIEKPDLLQEKKAFLGAKGTEFADYLLDLNEPLDVEPIYRMIRFGGFKDTSYIKIHYASSEQNDFRVRSMIEAKENHIIERAIYQDGETFHVYRSGDCEYVSDQGVEIDYNASKDNYTLLLKANTEKLETLDVPELIKRIKKQFNEVKKMLK